MSKTVNVSFVYDLDVWPRNPTNNGKYKNCLFGAASVDKKRDTERYEYSVYRITYNSAGSWSFNNAIAGYIKIFVVDNSSSSQADNRMNNFLLLGVGPTFGTNGRFLFSREKV